MYRYCHRMSYSSSPPDPLIESLNPLVRRGTLTSAQADEVYRAVRSDPRAPTSGGGEEMPPVERGWQPTRLLAGLCVMGATLLLAALLIAAANSEESLSSGARAGDDFNAKAFSLMVLITLFLAVAAAGSHLLLRDRPYARLVTSALAAFTLLAIVTTVGATWDGDGLVYLGGVLLLLGGAAGYWYLKGLVFVPVAVLGGAVLLAQVLSDTLDESDASSGTIMTIGMSFLVYGLVVAAAGWRFSCRNLAGMLGGGIALAAMWLTVVSIGFASLVVGLTQVPPGAGGPSGGPSPDDARTDLRIAMVLGLVVALALVFVYAYTSYSGYLVLAFLGAVSLPGTAVALSRPDHPLRWSILFAVVGAIAAAGPIAVLWRQLRQGRQQPGQTGPPPSGPSQSW